MIFVGIALATPGPAWFDGFPKGLRLGAGVTLMLLGVIAVMARGRARSDGSWLPRRDE